MVPRKLSSGTWGEVFPLPHGVPRRKFNFLIREVVFSYSACYFLVWDHVSISCNEKIFDSLMIWGNFVILWRETVRNYQFVLIGTILKFCWPFCKRVIFFKTKFLFSKLFSFRGNMISEGWSDVPDQSLSFYFPSMARKAAVFFQNVSFWARMDFCRASKMHNDF